MNTIDENLYEEGMIELVEGKQLLQNALEILLSAGVPNYLVRTIIKAQDLLDQAEAELVDGYESAIANALRQ